MPSDLDSFIDTSVKKGGEYAPVEDTFNITPQTPSNLRHAMDKDPDKQSAVYQIAESLNIHPKTAEENFEEVKKRQQLAQFNAAKNPILAKFLSNQENAEVSHDDIDTLGQIEDHVGAFNSGVLSLPATVVGSAATAMDIGKRKIKQYLPKEIAEFMTTPIKFSEPEEGEEIKTLTDALRSGQKSINDLREWLSPAEKSRDSTSMQIAGGLGQMFTQVGQSLVAPQTVMPSLFGMGVEQQAERQRESGTYGESDTALIAGGVVTSALEKIGLDKLLERVPENVKDPIRRKLTDIIVGGAYEGGTEVLEDIAHGLIEQYTTNPDADVFGGIEQSATVGGAVGAIVKAAMPGPSYRPVDKKKKLVDNTIGTIEQTVHEQQFIDTLIPLLAQSKTSKRNTKAFKRFVDSLPEGIEVRINPAAFEGIEGIPDYVQTQIDGLGTDVVVKMDQLTKDFVENPELLNAARKHMRISETAMTQHEIETGSADTIKNLMEEAKANATLKNEADAIFKDIVDQLAATGRMSKESARMNAVLIPAYITVKAKQTGLGVAEIYDRMNLTIKKMDTPTEEIRPDFGDEKITTNIVLEETGQKGKIRELKQVVYDRLTKRRDIVAKLRDCLNA